MSRTNRILLTLAVCAALSSLGFAISTKLDGSESAAQPLVAQPVTVQISDDSKIPDAVQQIESHAGDMKVMLPRSLPDSRLHLRTLQLVLPPDGRIDAFRRVTMDYWVDGAPPTGAGSEKLGPRLQVTQQSYETVAGNGDVIELGVPGMTAHEIIEPEGAGYGFIVSGKGRSFIVAVWGSQIPSLDTLHDFVRGLAAQ